MTITAAQIREARRRLRRSSAALSKLSGVEFFLVLKAQLDAKMGSVDPEAVRVLQRALERAGVDFTPTGVRLRTPRPRAPAPSQIERTEPACPTSKPPAPPLPS